MQEITRGTLEDIRTWFENNNYSVEDLFVGEEMILQAEGYQDLESFTIETCEHNEEVYILYVS